MKFTHYTALAALAVTLGSNSALAADASSAAPAQGQSTASKDFGKLSTDGAKAFRDLRMARVAIFDGQIDKAKGFAQNAQTDFNKAKTDDTIFTKAEADLKPGPGMKQAAATDEKPNTSAVAWIPVDGQMVLGEDYVATPEKAASVDKANTQIAKGNKTEALETLKIADIDVYFVEDVAPLDTTIGGVDKAVQLISDGHYYEANQALKAVEDGMRVDSDVLTLTPDKVAATKKS